MSTAYPTGTRTVAKVPPALTSDSTDDANASSGVTAQQSNRLNINSIPVSAETKVDVLVPDSAAPDSVLDDTVTFRLDDTQTDMPSAHLLERLAAHGATSTQAPSTQAPSVITLDAPSANGLLDGALYEIAKRSLDILVSSLLLVLLSPLLMASAIAIKLTDGGSIFYTHLRVGEGGNEFTCFKFRSMVVNADEMKANLAFFNSHDDNRTFKIPDDPRVTWIGRLMRRTSVDELPQLWNVLCGQMSLVGPRPPVVTEVEQYTWDDMQRLAVKPGLTCIWQVSGRSRLPFPEQLKMDMEYIENRSLALDLKLIALTVPAVLSADGAY